MIATSLSWYEVFTLTSSCTIPVQNEDVTSCFLVHNDVFILCDKEDCFAVKHPREMAACCNAICCCQGQYEEYVSELEERVEKSDEVVKQLTQQKTHAETQLRKVCSAGLEQAREPGRVMWDMGEGTREGGAGHGLENQGGC